MIKLIFVFIGSFFVFLGVLGIILPGMPATIFFLLASYFYLKSSPVLYNKLNNHRVFGKYIRDYNENKSMTRKQKISALAMMWVSISISTIFFLDNIYVRLLVLSLGLIGTLVLYKIKTRKGLNQ